MIAQFPTFSKLAISHEAEIKKHTQKYPPYCDYNFIALWCYNIDNEADISILNGNLVVKLIDCSNNKTYVSFFGKNKFEETCVTLLDYCNSNGIAPTLKVIPEVFIEKKSTYKKITITEDRHNHDYIYSLTELSELKGKKYNTKRYLFKKFNKLYPDHSVRQLIITKKDNHKDILDLFKTWEKNKNKKAKDTKNELSALSKILHYSKEFNYVSIGIFSENTLIAFFIAEIVNHGYAIIHFAKTNSIFTGINEALYKYLADTLIQKGCKYVNFEQDLGLENLRYAKTLWHPIFFLKKFDITLSKSS